VTFAPRVIASPDLKTLAPWLATGLAFLVLFWEPATTLGLDWWTNPDASHGLLLAPTAAYLAWRRGLARRAPRPGLGLLLLTGAVVLRYLSGLAAELFTMRVSMMLALVALIVSARGTPQVKRWALPLALLVLSIPIPAVVLASLALPLQLQASRIGAWLLATRHVPVMLAGNIITIPGHSLFVAEACSGLRSLSALLALGVLAGGLWLHATWTRAALVLSTIPVATTLNGVRIFLTGFLLYFVDPRLADGFSHVATGLVVFLAAFGALAAIAWGLRALERWHPRLKGDV
jgi:exosortase